MEEKAESEPSSPSDEDSNFSMRWKTLTLIDSLKAILKDYPANEQILKELIQNAEDAGAKDITFLYDMEEYTSDGLIEEDLEEFQGPALYAYNDKAFSRADFSNLVSIQKSKKLEDRCKVGRFGRGFKSVFHMTDLPCVLSDRYLSKINPSKENEELTYKLSKLLEKHPNELKPYLGKFGFTEAMCQTGLKYEGTIFRFPLRTIGSTSKVSDTVYTREKITNIFETLKTQASMNLLFLKSLESINVFTREPNGEQHQRLCVSVQNTTDPRLQMRGEFFKATGTKKLPQDESHLTYRIDINTSSGHSDEGTNHRFLVSHYFNSINVSKTFRKLLKDLSNNPIVSVAMPLQENPSHQCLLINDGHLFCFLPLPVDGKASPTGLPVHVNGFFAVDSRRSKMEWATDQDGNLDLEDMTAELAWNHCLVTELLPEAYARLLQDATIEESVQGSDIYRYFPSVEVVDEKWRETLLPPFFSRALKMPLFPTVGGCTEAYVTLDVAVICPPCLDEELQSLLVKLLVNAGKNVVCPPEHVMGPINEYCSPVEATPGYVRGLLKEHHCYKELLRPEKLCLLKFLIEDDAFDDLSGLALLPAADGSFLVFGKPDDCQVYIIDNERRKLLPTLENIILSTDLCPRLEDKLRTTCGQTQLRVCSDEDCLDLLPKVYPSTYTDIDIIDCSEKGLNHLTPEWVEQLWHFLLRIKDDFPKSLEKVGQLHILPVSSSKPLLAKLSGNTVYILNELHGMALKEEVSTLLKFFGIQVLHSLPDFVQHHPHVFDGNHIYQPHAESVIKAIIMKSTLISGCIGEMIKRFNAEATMDERKCLLAFLHPVVESSTDRSFIDLLKQLKIFETIGKFGKSGNGPVAVIDLAVGVICYDLPVKSSKDLLDLSSESARVLAEALGVRTLTETEILEEIIFDDIRKHLWSPTDLEKVMTLVLHSLDEVHSLKSTTFIPKLKELPFLIDSNKNWKKPAEMFDSANGLLKKLFIGEDKFPGSAYENCLAALRKLGLKTEAHIDNQDIINAAKLVQESNVGSTSLSTEDLEKKAKSIAQFLQENPHFRTPSFVDAIRDIEWIPVQSEKPVSYPSAVEWERPEKLFEKPMCVYSSAIVNVIGLSLPTVKSGAIPENLLTSLLDVEECRLPIQCIVSHLTKLINFYTSSEKLTFMKMACDVYSAMKDFGAKEVRDELRSQQLLRWLWHGDGFTSADTVVIGQMGLENLQPYVYRLPGELLKYKDWLLLIGAREEFELTSVLEEIYQWHSDNSSLATEERVRGDTDLAVLIANKIADLGVPDYARGNILLPVTGGKGLMLLPARECTYCDTKMDKSAMSTLQKSFQDDNEKIHYLHQAISKATATKFGVQHLEGRLFDSPGIAFASDEIKARGQEESLTERIAGLVEQNYLDGLVIPKELIQNADDAGAEEIRFLFDERQNEEYRTSLFDDGMKKYQGPALWVYNDKEFSEEDLGNILKLGGATKAKKRDKIGQFGLGFNAVYNITDLPSFVTGKYIVFFDPHRTHLGKVLKDKTPGLEINLCADTSRMALLKKRFADQFKPYDGIFNCSINEEIQQEPYNGTLFRLPLRPKGAHSEIWNHACSKSDVKNLLKGLVKQASELLLFAQNVKRIGVYHLSPSCTDPTNPVRVFEAECKIPKTIKQLPVIPDDPDGSASDGILKVADKLCKHLKEEKPLPVEPMHSCVMIETKSTLFSNEIINSDCFPLNGESSNQIWLLFSCIGKNALLESGRVDSCPVAGIAVKLHVVSSDSYTPEGYPDGAPVFCHLPLSATIQSGLPVIVNGSFALTPDRQHLLELPTTTDSAIPSEMQTYEASSKYQWNTILMKYALVEAYLGTLEQLTAYIEVNDDCDPYMLWPIKKTLNRSFQPLYESFYSEIATGQGRQAMIFHSAKGWVDFQHAVFLNETLARSPLKVLALTLIQRYLDTRCQGKVVVVLPEEIQQGFSNLRLETITLLQFYELAFFPVIGEVENPARDEFVKLALMKCKQEGDMNQLEDNMSKLVKSTACIPGKYLSEKFHKPGELIFPSGECGKLYGVEDERFPKVVFCNGEYAEILKLLGMAVDEITWEEVLHRAESVERLPDVQSRRFRVSALLAYIENKLARNEPDLGIITQMTRVKFLPILPRPKTCPLSWRGDEVECGAVGSATQLYPKSHHYLIGNLYFILDEKQCGLEEGSSQLFKLLELTEKVPSLPDVIKTVDELSRQEVGTQTKQDLETYCRKVYSYLDEYCTDDLKSEELTKLLGGKRCILVQDHFMEPEYVARNFDKTLHVQPYLSCVPHVILGSENLLKALRIRDEFNSSDYIDALHRMKADDLHEDKISIVRNIAECLQRCQERERLAEMENNAAVTQQRKNPFGPHNSILLPKDTDMLDGHLMKTSINDVRLLQLLPVGELCLRENSKSWLLASNLTYVHHAIPHKIARDLGVKSDCESIVSNLGCGLGQPFGQNEKLTTRIAGILEGYPKKEVLKELLQNADDAGASELKFILDHKGQSGDRVLSDAWKELQGPALCVYNDKPFTKKDLNGICSLGLGSKNTDPTKTGQYGIGFNSVYHLTDVPSFLTDGDEIGRTVAFLDPNCRFVPGATNEYPGWCFQGDQLANVAGSFPGSFSGYLENDFPVEGATMFRLPLRTHEAANSSKIRHEPVTPEEIEEFFANLQTEVFQCLLFVNSVRNISFMNTTNAEQDYWVKVNISEEDKVALAKFTHHMKNVSDRLKSHETPSEDRITLKDVDYEEVIYTLTFNDSKGRKEVWSVSQSFGFKDCKIPDEVQAAYTKGDISLLPRGGAAICKSHTTHSKHLMFCFLPLPHPENTRLPFHVNGHLALDRNRKGLRGPNGEGCYRTAWNKLIIEECIANACISLINADLVLLKKTMCPSLTDLKKLYSLFPDGSSREDGSYEQILISAFYKKLTFSESKFLAALALTESGINCRWFTVHKCIAGEAVFDDPSNAPTLKSKQTTNDVHSRALSSKDSIEIQGEESANEDEHQEKSHEGCLLTHQEVTAECVVLDNPPREANMENNLQHMENQAGKKSCSNELQLTIAEILSRIGYNLLEAVPQFIFTALRDVGENVQQISGNHVLTFLRQFAKHPEGTLKNLPQNINDSPFLNVTNLVKIIRYCLPRTGSATLNGLPLCLTSDDTLQVFDVDKPVFRPTFSMLIPERADLFVNKKIYYDLPTKMPNDGVSPIRKLTIKHFTSEVAKMPEYKRFLQERMEWDPSSEEGKQLGLWLQDLWRLIGWELAPTHDKPLNLQLVQNQLMPIHDFCIIPAYIEPAKRNVLCRIRDAKHVVHPERLSAYKSILPVLKKVGVPMLELSLVNQDNLKCTAIAVKIVTHQNDGVGTLNALWYLHQRGLLQVTKEDAELLLEYFSEYVCEYARCIKYKHFTKLPSCMLLALPIHITVNENIVSLEGCTVFLIPPEIPKAGLDNLFKDRNGQTEQFIFKEDNNLVALYEECGCCNKDKVEIYTELLLLEINFCHFLTEEERLEHLKFIAEHILPSLQQDSSEYMALMAALQRLPFVTDTAGQLRRAAELYNPKVPLYALMEKDFPSEKFLSLELLDLLKKCCMKSTMTADELVKYAEMIEAETQTKPIDETVKKKSKLVFKALKTINFELTAEMLFKMKLIRFIQVEECPSDMSDLHPQHLIGEFTCFQDSVLYDECDKCWTVAAILPSWIKASHKMTALLTRLEVRHPVPMKTVVTHCTRLSHYLASRNMAQKSSKDVVKYMTVVYDYLKNSKDPLDENDRKELEYARCIVVDEGQSLIQPCQVCTELPLDCQMKPYLYKLPRNLGPYDQLFCQIGVREQPDFRHFMDVLKFIHRECEGGDLVLDCNQEKTAKEAMAYFMQWIQKEDDLSLMQEIDVLYLLSRGNALKQSTDMVLVDDPRLLPDKAKEVVGKQVVGDIPGYTVHHLQRLPECIKPIPLSTLIEEVLDGRISCVAHAVDSGPVSCFRNRLQNTVFLDELNRLLHYDAIKRNEKIEVFNDCWLKLHHVLTKIKFFTVPKVVTVLRSKGTTDPLPSSNQESSKVFINMTDHGCNIYIQQNEEGAMLNRVQEQIAKYISTSMGICAETALILVQILSCHLEVISETLDYNHITQIGEGTNSGEPELGSFIPLVQHCLLKPDYVVFVDSEIVGLERDDPLNKGRDGEGTYMYAKIIRQIPSTEEENEMRFEYEVDLGDSTIIVRAFDIYKFTSKTSTSLPDKPFNLAEEKKKIKADLKYAFHSNSLTEDEQRKFLKRLVMKWQMESNTSLAAEMLQFCEEEVGRLQRELDDENEEGSTPQRSYDSHPWFSSSYIFEYARERANKHRTDIDRFREHESHTSSNLLDFSYLRHRGKNPQPNEAKRWFRQAKADLAASEADDKYGTEKAYEWALQKCHQAAEKALKAACYTLDSTREITHNLPSIASPLNNEEISELARNISGEISDGMSLRYPDRLSYPRIPHDTYNESTYRQVYGWTNELLNVIGHIVN